MYASLRQIKHNYEADTVCSTVYGALVFAEIVSALKRALARVLVVIVCRGLGIVKFVVVHFTNNTIIYIILICVRFHLLNTCFSTCVYM